MLRQYIIGKNSGEPIHSHEREGNVGLSVYTEPRIIGIPTGRPYINETFGSALNQNVSFGGTPENIHDGGDTSGWTATSIVGAWNFTNAGLGVGATAAVTIINANDLDTAIFEDATEINLSGYTAITGQLNLISYSDLTHDITLFMSNNGSIVGNSISLNDYINTALIGSYQSFVVPKGDLGLNGSTVDQMTIIINRGGGSKPTIYFDLMQIEKSGSPLVYKLEAKKGTKFIINRLLYQWADVGTGGTAFSYNKIGAVPQLSNGIVLNAVLDGKVSFSSTITNMADIFATGAVLESHVDDGVNTFVGLGLPTLREGGIILDSRTDDFMSLTVNDNLSGLSYFLAFVSGIEVNI